MKLADINALRDLTAAELIAAALDVGATEGEAAACLTKDALRLLVVTKVAEREHADEVAFGPWAAMQNAANREAMAIDFAGKRLIDRHNEREIRPYKRTKAYEEGGTGAWFCREYVDGVLVDEYTTSCLYLRDHTREFEAVTVSG